MHQQALIDELGVFLDARQAELLETLARLGELRAAVIRRDEATLTQLLEQVQQDADRRCQMEAEQRSIEQRLLEAFDGLRAPVTLTRVCELVSEDRRAALGEKQAAMLETARRLENELDATEMLLRECARCNRELLAAILGRNQQSVTYDPQGRNQWDVHRGLVSVKL